MTQRYWPFDSGAGANSSEDRWRDMARLWLPTGPIDGELLELEVFGDSTGMQVKVRSGIAWVRGHYFDSDATETLTVSANASGNPRIDRVVLRGNFTADTIVLAVVTGTPAASPSAPALTQSATVWEVPLGLVAVASGASTIAAGNVTDERDMVTAGHRQLAGELLACTSYDPVLADNASTTATSSTLHDADATDLAVTFTVPRSGAVLVRLDALAFVEDTSTFYWGLREGGSAVAESEMRMAVAPTGASVTSRLSYAKRFAGLTPGASLTWKWAFHAGGAVNPNVLRIGATDGAAVMEVWAA